MSLVGNGARVLTNDELDRVTGGALIEFSVGPVRIQMNTDPNDGGAIIWNGGPPILSHEPVHGRGRPA